MRYGPIQDNGNSFSSANSNTHLPTTNIFQSGSADDSVQVGLPFFDPPFLRTASVDGSANQWSALTPTNLSMELTASADFSGSTDLMFGSALANSQYSLVFNLTNPYVVHLTGDIGGEGVSDGSFDGEIHLTGPGLQFDQVLIFPMDSSDDKSFDEVFTLGPGQYTLNAVAGLDGQQFYFLDSSPFVSSYLNADFTPAVPEPAQVSTVLGVLMVIGIFFARRHGQNRLSV